MFDLVIIIHEYISLLLSLNFMFITDIYSFKNFLNYTCILQQQHMEENVTFFAEYPLPYKICSEQFLPEI